MPPILATTEKKKNKKGGRKNIDKILNFHVVRFALTFFVLLLIFKGKFIQHLSKKEPNVISEIKEMLCDDYKY